MTRTALAVLTDLFFVAKIQAVARAAGVTLHVVPPAHAEEACAAYANTLDLVIVDLHATPDMPEQAGALKTATPARIVGFYSHVDGEVRRRALAAGVDQAIPRSAFVTQLGDLLTGNTAAPQPPRSAEES